MTSAVVVHVNDVAGVASAAVAEAQRAGLPWRLWPLPAVQGRALPVKIWARLRDLWRFRTLGRRADLLHVHFGHFAYYAWSVRRPYVLHLHGTDINANLQRPILGRLTRLAIRRAAAVVYSTPDLADAVHQRRPDAIWLPAPLDAAVFDETAATDRATPQERPRVVYASRWDSVKGLPELLRVAGGIAEAYPDAEQIGIDWGVGAADARLAGVRLLPLLRPAEFRALLVGADIVVGQLASGALGVADLTAMALRRPLIARFTQAASYGSAPAIWNSAELDPLDAVDELLKDASAPNVQKRCAAAREWVIEHHAPHVFVQSVQRVYDDILGH